MTKIRERCTVCEYVPVNVAGWWTFMPLVCCETISMTRKGAHKRGAKK